MTTVFIIFLVIWFLFVFAFMFVFVKNDYDIEETMRAILFKKNKNKNKTEMEIEVTNVKKNKNRTKEIIGEENIKKTEEEPPTKEEITEMKENNEEDCEHAGGLILNICDSNEYSEEEKILRAKILEKLKKTPTYFQENGVNKLIVPLEIMVFLNNDLNPIVSENGEIILSIENQRENFIIKDKETGEEIFKSREEMNEALLELEKLKKEADAKGVDVKETIKEKVKTSSTKDEEKVTTQEEKETTKTEKRKEEKNTLKKESEIESQKIEEDIGDDLIEEDLSDLEDDIEITPTKEEINNISIEDELGDELDSLIEQTEKKPEKTEETKNIKDFLSKREWQEGENMTMNWKEVKEEVLKTFENEHNLNAFLSNIIKQKPLIPNDNKTAIFVDLKILNRAFAELYGNDSDTLLKKLARMPNKLSELYQIGMELSLSDFISDLVTDEKRMSVSYFSNGNKNFKGYGLWIKTDAFKRVLDSEDFDLFRTYIYNEGIKMSVQSNNSSQLISDIFGTVIK